VNLLDATVTLLDAVKTFAPDTVEIKRAARRMEKRLLVLQVRAAKSLRRRRWNAFYEASAMTGDVVRVEGCINHHGPPKCQHCAYQFDFGSSVREADICGRAHIKQLYCPACGYHMIGLSPPEEAVDP